MSTPDFPPRTIAPDDALPPVEPPSARFLIQLFVIPGVIVLVIVSLWLGFTWLVSDSGDPRTYLEHVRSNSQKRWHAAVYLAGALADDQHAALRGDGQFMAEMAAVLDADIAAGDMDEYPVRFRSYLCRGLGHFRVASGLPSLVTGAMTQRDPAEVEVRLSALEALAQVTDNIRQPVAEKLLPQTAALARRLAESAASNNGGEDIAGELRAVAAEAEALAAAGKATPDTGARSAAIAQRLPPLVDRAEGRSASAADRDTIAELRATAVELSRQSREAAAVDWQPSSPLARAALAAADFRSDATRFDAQLDREAAFDYMIRLRGAYLLGVLGGREATAKLEELLADPRSVVAYNAAAGLCRHGVATEKLVGMLAEMIASPQVEIEEPKLGHNEASRARLIEHDRSVIVANGLRAVELLARRNPAANLDPAIAAIEQVVETSGESKLSADAKTLLQRLRSR